MSANGLSAKPVIALLAGSRKQEIKDNLPDMLRAAASFPDYQLVLAGAPGISPRVLQTLCGWGGREDYLQQDIPFVEAGRGCTGHFGDGNAGNSSVSCAASGMLPYSDREGYRFLKRHILKVKYISLVNLIANREVVKELVADTMTVEQVRSELNRIFVR